MTDPCLSGGGIDFEAEVAAGVVPDVLEVGVRRRALSRHAASTFGHPADRQPISPVLEPSVADRKARMACTGQPPEQILRDLIYRCPRSVKAKAAGPVHSLRP